MKDSVIEWQKHTLEQNKTKQVEGGGGGGVMGEGERGSRFW